MPSIIPIRSTNATVSSWVSSTTTERAEDLRLHRAVRRLDLPRRRWLVILLLPGVFDALLWLGRDRIAAAWYRFFVFWIDWLEMPAEVSFADVELGTHLGLRLPVLQVSAGMPDGVTWLGILGLTLAVLTLSFATGERYAPLRYLLRLGVVVQATALLCFAVFPASFPYTVRSHTRDGLLLTALLLMMIPWLYAFTYYLYPFSLLQKVGLTAMSLGYFLIFGPVQYLVHAWLLHRFSLLLLPSLYLLFGILIDMLMLVALYGWGMSWKCRHSEDAARLS